MIIFKNFILKISSLRFAISLIIFIAITSGIGTFIPQGSSNEFYIDNFDSAPIFGFLDGEKVLKLQLDHIYTSFWFLLTLILLCISLAACSFRRQIPSLKASLKWIEYNSEKKFSKLGKFIYTNFFIKFGNFKLFKNKKKITIARKFVSC